MSETVRPAGSATMGDFSRWMLPVDDEACFSVPEPLWDACARPFSVATRGKRHRINGKMKTENRVERIVIEKPCLCKSS